MAYKIQLGDLRSNTGIQSISGVCSNGERFAEQVNDVTERLMQRGSWWQTEQLMKLCFQGCHIVWPQQVGTVLGVRFCKGGTAPIKNNWWAVAGYTPNGCGLDTWFGGAVIRDDGTRPCYNEITGNTGKFVKLHIVNNRDIGKTIKIFGFKYGNQPLQEKDADGVWQMGLTITATQTGTTTTELVTKITNVVKEESQGRFFLYQVDPTTAELYDLAVYEPGETNPSYRCSVIQNLRSIPGYLDDNDRCIRQCEALVKLQFVPARSDNDFVMLDNKAALELGIAALRAERANDDVLANIKWSRAIQELNAELRNRFPSAQTTIRTNYVSSSCVMTNPI